MNSGNGVWKWIAAILVAILLSGLPGYINLLIYQQNTPSKADLGIIADRQQNVLQRLAVVESKLDEAHAKLEEINKQLRDHEILDTERFSNRGGR